MAFRKLIIGDIVIYEDGMPDLVRYGEVVHVEEDGFFLVAFMRDGEKTIKAAKSSDWEIVSQYQFEHPEFNYENLSANLPWLFENDELADATEESSDESDTLEFTVMSKNSCLVSGNFTLNDDFKEFLAEKFFLEFYRKYGKSCFKTGR